MFKDNLQSPRLVDHPKIGPLAWRICEECGGLPLLIEKVASTFKVKNDECLWSDGLNSWRIWPQKECQGIIELYNFFKICYDDLDDAQKQCFLYGALYPENSDIYTDYLLERWKAEDFLVIGRDTGGNQTIIGSLILSHLKNVSLLEESKSEKFVTMHKFIRQVALYISSTDPICMYLVKTNGAFQEPMDAESWSHRKYISLSENEFNQLPNCPDSSMLSTLFLQKNLGLKTIPALFFHHMKNLRVLDLCESEITSLPESFARLDSLKVLCLFDCKYLIDFPLVITELSGLEVLDIRGSGMHEIPTFLEKMKGLRRLRVSLPQSGNENVTVNNFKIISKLSKLEELVIDMESIEQWSNKPMVLGILQNVATLEKFTVLRFCFPGIDLDVIEVASQLRVHVPDAQILQTFVEGSCLYEKVKRLKKFQIFIAFENSERHRIPNFAKYQRYIKYLNGEDSDPLLPEVVSKPDAFELVNHKNIKQLTDFKAANMEDISALLVESCAEIETIIGTIDRVIISKVEHLYMKNLPKLESIWKEPLQLVCLTKLKTLFLSRCHKVIQIFPHGVVQRLGEMQHIEIEECSEIVEIFEEFETNGYTYVLPKLKKLILLHMPKLEFICKNKSLKWPSLEELEVYECPSIKSCTIIPRVNAPKLSLERFKINELHRCDVLPGR